MVEIEATSHVAYHVAVLERQGLVRREPGRSRGLMSMRPTGLPVLGTIAAGDPLDLFEADEFELLEFGEIAAAMTTVPAGMESEVYALRVRGTSMIDDGILNGDYVLVARGSTATNGAIVVAVHNAANGGHGAATLKRVFIGHEGVRLQPANAEFNPRFISAEEWNREWIVRGTVVAVYRQYAPHRTTVPRQPQHVLPL
jgi:repressor LexA